MLFRSKNSNDWFVGNVNGEEVRNTKLSLDFLDAGKKYVATIYKDGKDAHYKTNPQSYEVSKKIVEKGEVIDLRSASGGGFAISIKVAGKKDLKM